MGWKNQSFIYKCFDKNIDCNKYLLINTNDYKKDYREDKMPPNPDIILEWKNHVLFIECKTNGLSYDSIKWEITNNDYNNKIKKNIRQVYRSIDFFINKVKEWDNYFWLIKTKKIIIPLITYIKNPYIWFWEYMNDVLNDIINEWKIKEDIIFNHNPLILENIWVVDFINVINSLWLDVFLNEVKREEYNWWEIEWIINHIISNHKIKDNFKFEIDMIDILEKEARKNKSIDL